MIGSMRRHSTGQVGCVISVLTVSVIAITPALETSSLVGAKLWREAVFSGGGSPVKGGKISSKLVYHIVYASRRVKTGALASGAGVIDTIMMVSRACIIRDYSTGEL